MPTYTTLKDVRRVLRSSDSEVVRFSDSLVSVTISKADPRSAPLGFNDSEIEYDDTFEEKLNLKIEFKSPTEFDVYKIGQKRKYPQLLQLGANISDNWNLPNGLLTIKKEAWFGNIEEGDIVELSFDPHISNVDAEEYIRDVEVQIDAMITAGAADGIVDGNTRLFGPNLAEPKPIPPQVAVATTYLTAYYLYTDLFVRLYKDDDANVTYSGRWKRRAERYIKDYITTENIMPPHVVTFDEILREQGNEGALADACGCGGKCNTCWGDT